MRILIDLQGAQNNSRDRGIGRYSLSIARAICRNASPHQVFILLNGLFPDTLYALRQEFSDLLPPDRILVFIAPGPVDELRAENRWRRLSAEILREYVIDLLEPDFVFVTSLVEGAEDESITSLGSISSNVLTAVVAYDLIPLSDPDRYIGWAPARNWYFGKLESLQRADILFAISQSSGNEVSRLLKVNPDRIKVIYAAAADLFTTGAATEEFIGVVKRRFGINKRFLMHSSAFEERKNFQGLLRAFAALPQSIRIDYQLVFVCKINVEGRQELASLAESLGLSEADLIVTGFVSDEELKALYTACHLFVFPSFHEGFGLPALEAMCCGTPAIGADATSVPEVIGRSDALFDPNSLPEMTALICRALTERNLYQSLKTHATNQAARFSWDESARCAIAAMQECFTQNRACRSPHEDARGKRRKMLQALAAIPSDCAPGSSDLLELARCIEINEHEVTRLKANAAFSGHLAWRLEGPFDSSYSLALVNRETARALQALGHTVVLHSTEGPGDFPANPRFLDNNGDLALMHSRVDDYPQESVDAVSRLLYPPRVSDMRGRINLLHHYAWEESGFPGAWVESFNECLDGITCLSSHVEKLLLDNGVDLPMTVSGCGVDHFERIVPNLRYSVEARAFRFLHVSSCFPRKGVDTLLEAYGLAFSSRDDVSLIIKTFANPHNTIHSDLVEWRARFPHYPHLVVIDEDLADSDLKALYQQCHALVAPSRAEGFGLPLAEAMLSGLPVITTGWSGQLDFCSLDTAWLVGYGFGPAQTHFGLYDSVWAEPNCEALAQAMGAASAAPVAERRKKSEAGREYLLQHFKWTDVTARMVVATHEWRNGSNSSLPSRIGWVTSWNTRCGIASYSEHLISCFPRDVTVFAPHESELTRPDEPNCIRSWYSSKDENRLDELSRHIVQQDIGTLIVQFNFSFFNFREFKQFLSDQVDAGRIVIVMMHSTSDPGNEPPWNWSLSEMVPALSRCQRLLVHTLEDLNRLKSYGLIGNVTLFPHGVLDVPVDTIPLPVNEIPLVAAYGYCLPHKGLIELVQAVKVLCDRGSRVRLRLLNAEYPNPVSAALRESLKRLISELDLQDTVEARHDYLSDTESLGLLQGADLIVFPYQDTKESASGAVRFGLATHRPVAVTPIPIFADLGDTVFRLPGTGPEAIANGISSALFDILHETQRALEIRQRAKGWWAAHTYSSLSERLARMCSSLSRALPSSDLYFYGSSRRLGTEVGRIAGRSLVSTGAAGYLLTGPIVKLAAGTYCLTVVGRRVVPVGAAASLSVCFADDKSLIVHHDLLLSNESVVVDLELRLLKPMSEVQVKLHVDMRVEIQIDRLQFIRRTATERILVDNACIDRAN